MIHNGAVIVSGKKKKKKKIILIIHHRKTVMYLDVLQHVLNTGIFCT